MTRTSLLRLLKYIGIATALIVLIGYGSWRSFNYARGPEIHVSDPSDGAQINSPTTIIRGRASRVNDLLLNGSPLPIDEMGNFMTTVVIFPGVNLITIAATDKFGRAT